MAFERARTELAGGARLRRMGKRGAARGLASALTTFSSCGAEGWAAHARSELDAMGQGRRRAPEDPERLTAREQQVARLAGDGLTNREVGARLCLSEKTGERHLGSVYRKLGLRSRTQLARRLALEEAAGGPEV